MNLGDKLLRIERRLTRGLTRLAGRSGAPREPFELVGAIVEEIAEHVEPAGGGARVFPYNRVVVRLVVPAGRAAAARAVLEHGTPLRERVCRRLEEAGCRTPADLRVTVRIEEGDAPAGEEFQLDLGRRGALSAADAAAPAELPRVRLVVLAGEASERSRLLSLERIRIGRMATVVDRRNRVVRHNQLAFGDSDQGVNGTVSRAHAHIEWVPSEAAFRVFDDGSAQGTRIEREGRAIDVPRRSAHGVLLRSGDVLCLGQARVRFTVED
jgi:hypothetical protein